MKVRLLYERNENDIKLAKMNKNDVIQDLNLDIIYKFMARNDKYIYKTVRSVMLNSLTSKDAILYRQEIMADCISNYTEIYRLYEMSSKTIDETERFNESIRRHKDTKSSHAIVVYNSLEHLGILVRNLEEVKSYCDKVESKFTSKGLRSFYEDLVVDYNPEFVSKIKESLSEMNFLTTGGDITFSATMGPGFKAHDIIVNRITKEEYTKKKPKTIAGLLFYKLMKKNVIFLDDGHIQRDAKELEAAGLAHILKLYQNFIRELTVFFETLHFQLAFYVGCANLKIRLDQMYLPTTFPNPLEDGGGEIVFRGLYDLSLGIYSREKPICNDLEVANRKLFVITGANQGGKTTYLRSIGITQIMMQAGMFVPADYYSNRLYDGLFTHFTRREDVAMNSGKLDEELKRMSRILNDITSDSLFLMNESFATTTEREGSDIATDVVNALYENNTHVIIVTHLYEFTKQLYAKQPSQGIFLSAERLSDGTRTFRMMEKEPERTSYGLDLYDQIVGKFWWNDYSLE